MALVIAQLIVSRVPDKNRTIVRIVTVLRKFDTTNAAASAIYAAPGSRSFRTQIAHHMRNFFHQCQTSLPHFSKNLTAEVRHETMKETFLHGEVARYLPYVCGET